MLANSRPSIVGRTLSVSDVYRSPLKTSYVKIKAFERFLRRKKTISGSSKTPLKGSIRKGPLKRINIPQLEDFKIEWRKDIFRGHLQFFVNKSWFKGFSGNLLKRRRRRPPEKYTSTKIKPCQKKKIVQTFSGPSKKTFNRPFIDKRILQEKTWKSFIKKWIKVLLRPH